MYTKVDLWFVRAASFVDIGAGMWFRTPEGKIVVGCPTCKAESPIAFPPHALRPVEDNEGHAGIHGRIFPSWVCPAECGAHAVAGLRDVMYQPSDPGMADCLTCGHLHPSEHVTVGMGISSVTLACSCGCVLGTPGANVAPIFTFPKGGKVSIGCSDDDMGTGTGKSQVVLGIGCEESVAVHMTPETAVAIARSLVESAQRAAATSSIVVAGAGTKLPPQPGPPRGGRR